MAASELLPAVRREAPCRIPGAAGRDSKGGPWVQWLYPDPKGEGDHRLPGKRRSGPGVGLRRRGTRVIWRRLDCLIAQSPADAKKRPSERHLLPALCSATASCWGRRNLRGAERCPARAIKETNGTPTSRSDVRQGRTRDQPTGSEPHGDSGPVVVVGVAPHRGGRESRPHGDMSRATYPQLSPPLV